MNWIGLHVQCSIELRDIVIAELSVLPFSTFEETENGVSAFCEEPDWDEQASKEILNKYNIESFHFAEVERVNWNEEWEKNYDPIQVGDQLMVRAPFHEPSGLPMEIVILPKMSFGTGHHATTYLVLDYQLQLDHKEKKTLDVGSGTGVLAIMASMLGAKDILAIDIGDWCVENSIENFSLNNCEGIEARQAEIFEVEDEDYEIVLANITKGVHKELMPEYYKRMIDGATLVLSGFFKEDIEEVRSLTEENGFRFEGSETHNGWARVVCTKQ